MSEDHTISQRRWKATCAYDGTAFAGWQSQPNRNGVQDHIERRLTEVFKRPVRIHGSGRTDAGVHARGQVFHFDVNWRHDPNKLRLALKVGLPPGIQIKTVRATTPDFHARFSARGKRYQYHLYEGDADPFTRPFVWVLERPRRLDVTAMQAAAERLRGRHDFRAFAADNGAELEDPVRDLRKLQISRRGRSLRLDFEADGFLYKMVRSLTGALVGVGEGRLAADEIGRILRSGKRTQVVETAPPQGLFLDRVFY
jgi:tRNA pseudouridine38-40 synthase